MKLNLILNGEDVTLNGDPNESLFEVLQREQGLFSGRLCCQKGNCGRCNVLLDSREVPSCLIPLYQVRGREVVTPEGFLLTDDYRRFLRLLQKEGLVFCRQCTDAQIFHIHAYLEQFPDPAPADCRALIAELPCRCGSRPVLEKGLAKYLEEREAPRGRR